MRQHPVKKRIVDLLKMLKMHDQAMRLYLAAKQMRELDRLSDVARLLEISPQTLKNWEERGISSDGMLKAQKLIGCNANWLATGVGTMRNDRNMSETTAVYLVGNPQYPSIRRVALHLQAGVTGFTVENDPEDAEPIVFRKDWFTRHGYQPSKMIAMTVRGDSMEPGLFDGDTIVINTAQTEPKDGAVFAINYEGEPVVKRMVRDGGQWWLASDNQDQARHPRKIANGTAIIIGQVVHRQSERI